MTLVDAKYDNFTRFIYDAVTPVWKLLFKKSTFWHLLASNKVSCKERGLIDPELQIFFEKCLLFLVIFEPYIMLFIKNYTHTI